MKCIYCGTNTRYRTRSANGERCEKCNRSFAFEPRNDDHKVTDAFFQGAIKGTSGESKLFFTERQLWYQFNQHLRRKGRLDSGGVIVTIPVILFCVWMCSQAGSLPLAIAVGVILTVVAIVIGMKPWSKSQVPAVKFSEFRTKYLDVWTRAHGAINGLLADPSNLQPVQLSASEPDLTAYSFDRALVTANRDTAAMLVANNFHMENSLAILSMDGYPPGLTDTLMTMLQRNPQLLVYALHDASSEGCRMPLRLRHPDWFPDPAITIFDLGLRPRQAIAQKLLTLTSLTQAIPDEVRQMLTPKEIVWLERGNKSELAAVRPAQLMRAIRQGLGRGREYSAEKETSGAADEGAGAEIIWIFGGTDGDGDGDGGDDGDGFG